MRHSISPSDAARPHTYVLASLLPQAGASGFLLKTAPPRELAAAIRTIAAGEALLAPAITRRMIQDYVRRPRSGAGSPARPGHAHPRELEVLTLIAHGRSNAEIGAALFLSEPTIKTHVTRILAKLQLRDRVQAVVFAYESGLIQPGIHWQGGSGPGVPARLSGRIPQVSTPITRPIRRLPGFRLLHPTAPPSRTRSFRTDPAGTEQSDSQSA